MELTPADLIAIIAIIATSLTAIVSLIVTFLEKKSERDFEARRKAEDYYSPLYGQIAILHEVVTCYYSSLKTGKTKRFSFKDNEHKISTSDEILEDFRKAYDEFTSFYIKKKGEGFELFVSEKLKDKLMDFWSSVEIFYENNEKMKDKTEIEDFNHLTEEIIKVMENLYGLN